MNASEFFNKNKSIIRDAIKSAVNYHQEQIGWLGLGKKINSEILSKILGKKIKEYLENNLKNIVVCEGKSDNDYDTIIVQRGESLNSGNRSIPLEIKVTSAAKWRGGEFSMRECHHLMVYWDYDEQCTIIKVYACISNLTKKDWDSNIKRGYYAPYLHRWKLATDKRRIDIVGNILGFCLSKIGKKFVNIECEEIV